MELWTSWQCEEAEAEAAAAARAEAAEEEESGGAAAREGSESVGGDPRERCCITLRTVRELASGDELLLSYVDTAMGVASRRQALAHWGFTCACARCVAEEATPIEARRTGRKRMPEHR